MSGVSLRLFAMLFMAIFLVIDRTVADEDAPQSTSQRSAALGAIVMLYISGFGWLSDGTGTLPEASRRTTAVVLTLCIASNT